MNRKTACTALVALAVTLPAIALAEDNDRRDERRDERAQERDAHHRYHKGERLREEERRDEYVVNDWHARNLREPPRGYHWVRNGDDVVLAAIATGVIADVIVNNR
jgi:Ni/Co efflux regulator RcnB